MKIYDAMGDVVFDNGPVTLRGIIFDRLEMRGWQMQHLDLEGCRFYKCGVEGANFTGTNLNAAIFENGFFCGCHFDGAQLSTTLWQAPDVRNTTFCEANLSRAKFTQMHPYKLDFTGADLTDFDLGDGAFVVDFRKARLGGLKYMKFPDHALVDPGVDTPRGPMLACWQNKNWNWTATIQCYGGVDCTSMQIGCQRHSIKDWFSFSDAEIAEMACGATEFYNSHKEELSAACLSVAAEGASYALDKGFLL